MKPPSRQNRLFSLLTAFALPVAAAEVDLGWTTRVVAEAHQRRTDSIFGAGLDLTSFGSERGRIEQELRGRVGPASVLLTATATGQQQQKPETRVVVHEAFVDFSVGGERFTAGKKILSGDVGYAFRPIDILQRESRLQLQAPPLEGVPALSWDNFTDESAWSVVLTNPGNGQRENARDDGALALKLYHRAGTLDLHGIVRQSSRNGLELGVALAAVPHDALELHASVLHQQRGEQRVPLDEGAAVGQLLSSTQALESRRLEPLQKALIGATLTTESGISLLGELWWDGAANSAADWQRLARNAVLRTALLTQPGVPALAVNGANAASTRLFEQANLARRGALARVAWSDAASGWSAAADLLASLEDGGRTLTLSVGHSADQLRIDGGIRIYGGKPDSAFGLLPERRAIFVALSLAY
jgi:hypothetical protein